MKEKGRRKKKEGGGQADLESGNVLFDCVILQHGQRETGADDRDGDAFLLEVPLCQRGLQRLQGVLDECVHIRLGVCLVCALQVRFGGLQAKRPGALTKNKVLGSIPVSHNFMFK